MRPERLLVPITDCVDIAANEIRASLLEALDYDVKFQVEPAVNVLPAFSVINANFVMRLMADNYPPGTLFLSTVNPLKQRPASVLGRTEKNEFIFIGRNTGVFDWLTRDFGCSEIVDLQKNYGSRPADFVSFAGKYVTAPLAARAAKGIPFNQIGNPLSTAEITRLTIAEGTIVHIDNFGLMKFTGFENVLQDAVEEELYEVTINGKHIEAVFGRRMMSYETSRWVLFPGSSFGLFELGMVRNSGVAELQAKVGDVLSISRKLLYAS